MEIDKAKRIYGVSCKNELTTIKNSKPEDYNTIPEFLDFIGSSKIKNKKKSKDTRSYATPMDDIYKIKEANRCKTRHVNEKEFFDIINMNLENSNTNSTFYKPKANEVLKALDDVINEIDSIKSNYNDENYNKILIKQDIQIAIDNASIYIIDRLDREYTLNLVIKELTKDKESEDLNEKLWILLYSLYENKKELFKKLFTTKEKHEKLIEDSSGNYIIFNKKYAKINN